MTNTVKSNEKINDLLKGEISAIETYDQVIDKIVGEPEAPRIIDIKTDHTEAVNILKNYLVNQGHIASSTSGAWGWWAKVVTSTAKVFGDEAALKALKEGEEHGIKEYQKTLEDPDVDDSIKNVIRLKLLPKQREHIQVIDSLM